ncbi:hypothetical protein L6452_34829 [Arctium lappa]|uniref:Uncharacterized protein n=1 Tax=Arctium lappa TaxID=4217 RepID=A0ACB8YJE3_ARCLA|nr:hypothetical protein L6452_34829 [Arctium lappa]
MQGCSSFDLIASSIIFMFSRRALPHNHQGKHISKNPEEHKRVHITVSMAPDPEDKSLVQDTADNESKGTVDITIWFKNRSRDHPNIMIRADNSVKNEDAEYRHLMLNLVLVLLHCKKDNKVESKATKGATLNELVELNICSSWLFLSLKSLIFFYQEAMIVIPYDIKQKLHSEPLFFHLLK